MNSESSRNVSTSLLRWKVPGAILIRTRMVLIPTSACLSFSGLKSRSCMITVSAAVRLIPSPPAFVDKRKIGIELPSLLKLSMSSCLSYKDRYAQNSGQ
jgi:hypothetical protein